MEVQELELPQVVFRLTVRKEGLQTLSIVEAVRLLDNILTTTQFHTMNNAYVVQVGMMFDGVMISINT